MMNYNEEDILLGQSGGINSAATLCWLKESGMKPRNLYIYYAHFREHSPDTFQFVADCIRFARKNFDNVHVKITRNSVLDFFRNENFIPHPANSPCSKKLKIETANSWALENDIKIDLVGYVKHEVKRRGNRQQKNANKGLFALRKDYPIGEFTDEWCFEIVKKYIGWYPAIYELKWNDVGFMKFCKDNLHRFDENEQHVILKLIGTNARVFKHNNCLPCKNMYPHEILAVEYFYSPYHHQAMKLSSDLSKYWGRDKDKFHFTFGRDVGQESTCETCKF